MRRTAVFFFTALLTLPQVAPPTAGVVCDHRGTLRPVLGVAGAFVLGEAFESGVLAAGFHRDVGLAKTNEELIVFNRRVIVARIPAPPGPAEFFFDPEPAAYFPQSGELWTQQTSRIAPGARPHSLLRAVDDEVVLPGGDRVRLPEPVQEVEWMSEHWVVARTAGALYAIRAGAAEPAWTRLPEPAQ